MPGALAGRRANSQQCRHSALQAQPSAQSHTKSVPKISPFPFQSLYPSQMHPLAPPFPGLSTHCSLSWVGMGEGAACLYRSSIWCRSDYGQWRGGRQLPAATWTPPSVPAATHKLSHLVSYCSCLVSLIKQAPTHLV